MSSLGQRSSPVDTFRMFWMFTIQRFSVISHEWRRMRLILKEHLMFCWTLRTSRAYWRARQQRHHKQRTWSECRPLGECHPKMKPVVETRNVGTKVVVTNNVLLLSATLSPCKHRLVGGQRYSRHFVQFPPEKIKLVITKERTSRVVKPRHGPVQIRNIHFSQTNPKRPFLWFSPEMKKICGIFSSSGTIGEFTSPCLAYHQPLTRKRRIYYYDFNEVSQQCTT